MSVPGSNILATALTAIAPFVFQYFPFASQTVNSVGLDNNSYDNPITVRGSIQPVSRTLFDQYGLDLQRSYVWVYIPSYVVDVDRDRTGDQIVYNNITYQVLSKTDWFPIDRWTCFLAVKVGHAG